PRGIFRTVRFGVGEAHGQAEMMEFNYLSEHGAFKREASGRYSVDYDRIPRVIEELAKVLLQIEATGDGARSDAWFKQYDVMPVERRAAMKATSSVPVDVDPVFSFKEKLE